MKSSFFHIDFQPANVQLSMIWKFEQVASGSQISKKSS